MGENEMIKVSVLYPNEAGKSFDMDYYCTRHIALVLERVGAACKKVAIEQGLSGATPDAPAAFIAMGHMYYDSLEEFQAAFGPHAAEIMGDIPNYTEIQPLVQISEVKV